MVSTERDRVADERAATAYHEAGHAVWRVNHGLVLRHVSLVPDDAAGTSGHVLGGSGDLARRFGAGAWGLRDRERAQQEIMDCFVGQLAEARALGRPVDPRTWRGDARQARVLAVALSADDETAARLLLRRSGRRSRR